MKYWNDRKCSWRIFCWDYLESRFVGRVAPLNHSTDGGGGGGHWLHMANAAELAALFLCLNLEEKKIKFLTFYADEHLHGIGQ